MRRLFFGNVGGGTNPVMTLTAVVVGGNESIGFLIFGGVPHPNSIYIKGTKYDIQQIVTNVNINSGSAISALSFVGNALPCNSITLDINGTEHTFTNNSKTFANNDNIFEDTKTYTIKVVSIT